MDRIRAEAIRVRGCAVCNPYYVRVFLGVAGLWLAAATGAEVPLPAGDARALVSTACAACHGLDVVVAKRRSEPQWKVIVGQMVERGATLSSVQALDVVGYLSRHFGIPDRGKELVDGICTLCHEMDRVEVQELSREQWAGRIKGMIAEGAPVTDEEFALIVDYLAAHYGPKDVK